MDKNNRLAKLASRTTISKESARTNQNDRNGFTAARLVYISIDDNKVKAFDNITKFLHGYYGPEIGMENNAIYGPPLEVGERLKELADAGLTHFILGLSSLDRVQLLRLAEEVVPILR